MVSCVYPINEGMEVWTNTPKVLESRRKTLQLLLSNHDRKCLSCVRSGNCELQQLCKELGVTDEGYYDGERTPSVIDDSAVHMLSLIHILPLLLLLHRCDMRRSR